MTTPLIEPVTGPLTLAYFAHKLGRHRDRALVAVTSSQAPAHPRAARPPWRTSCRPRRRTGYG